ncbi:MAG: VanZ family protein [Candidatus Omnitrophica bacterium]|nr:VanZ family protein [Candidatus Omnitrophota bacterium]
MSDLKAKRVHRWMHAGVWTGLIYLTLPIMPPVWLFFSRLAWFPFFVIGAIVLVIISSLVVFINKRYIRRASSYVLLFLIAIVYLGGIRFLKIPVERVHFIEYGILVFLVYRALSLDFKNSWPYVGAFILTSLIGLGDEGIQYLLPNRYYSLMDVCLNCVSAALGLALVYVITRDKKASHSI